MFDSRYMLSQPGQEPTIPSHVMDTLLDLRDCIAPNDAVVLTLGEITAHGGLEWEWILDPTMTYYWADVPFRYAHIGTMLPITNTDPIWLPRPRNMAANDAEWRTRTLAFIGDAPRVWQVVRGNIHTANIPLSHLSGILDEQGYDDALALVDTPQLSVTVNRRLGVAEPPCLPRES
ncbi:MAG: hypothetical protein ACOYL5_07230 [Phototrophicaceae bacterium]